MKLANYHQLYRHEPSNDIPGDCYRTAIGCLLNMPPHKVPHFALQSWMGEFTSGDAAAQHWLKGLGWQLATIFFAGASDVYEAMRQLNPCVTYLLSGKSPRGNWSHVVIFQGGDFRWDPAPFSAKGYGRLDGPCPENGMYQIEFLVPIIEEY